MKKYSFLWNDDIYLVHVQFDMKNFDELAERDIVITRHHTDGSNTIETKTITNNGFRFIISRSCPEENGIEIEYNDNVTMKLYIIDDRAYYPTETYYEG